MRIRFGTYDWYPAVWNDFEGWIYVTRWNRVHDPIVLTHQARVMTEAQFRSE